MTINPSELAGLLALFWLPVFAVAGIVQWRLLRNRRRRLLWIIAGLPLEMVLAFAIWVSPIHVLFLPLAFLGRELGMVGFAFYGIPLQAAVVAAVIVTVVFWWMGRAPRDTSRLDSYPSQGTVRK